MCGWLFSPCAFPKEPKQAVEGGEGGQDCKVAKVDFREAEGAYGDAGEDEGDGKQAEQDIFLVHETAPLKAMKFSSIINAFAL